MKTYTQVTAAALFITFYDLFKVKDELSGAGAKLTYTAPWVVLIGAILMWVGIYLNIF